MKVLTERRLDDANDDRLTEEVVYFNNGCVVRRVKNAKGKVTESEILIRLVYGDRETVNEILELLTTKYARVISSSGRAPDS